MNRGLVTLTTDFGSVSEGPGIMEATIYGIAPNARVVHLCHEIRQFNTIDGARQLECVLSIPAGIHVCVVDPGVGSGRRGIVLSVTKIGVLIGPDNGVLIPAAAMAGGIDQAFSIDNQALLRQPVSTTFHGRDIFASVAGHISSGLNIENVGERIDIETLIRAPYGEAIVNTKTIEGNVIHINHFGNCILNIREEHIFKAQKKYPLYSLITNSRKKVLVQSALTFTNVANGEAVIYPDSYGRVGIAINLGNAADLFQLDIGDKIELCLEEK